MMKKTYIIIVVSLFLGLVLWGGGAYFSLLKEKNPILFLGPQYEVKDYQFIADGNGIVIDWKVTNQWDLFWHPEAKERLMTATSKGFLVQNVAKLRQSGMTNESGSDEYFYLDIFDLRISPIKKKRLDLWGLMPDDMKDDYELNGVLPRGIFEEDGHYYAAVWLEMKPSAAKSLGIDYPEIERYLKLDLETGQVEDVLKHEEVIFENSYYDFYIENSPVEFSSDNSYEKPESYDGQINLAVTDKKAAQLFSKKTAIAYQLLDIEDQTVKNKRELIDLQTQFLPIGTDIYDIAEFTLRYSRDDKEVVRVTSFEEFEQYYEEERLAEEEMLRQRREEKSNEQKTN